MSFTMKMAHFLQEHVWQDLANIQNYPSYDIET